MKFALLLGVFLLSFVYPFAAFADNKEFKFFGFYTHGVTLEAITPEYKILSCILAPLYNHKDGGFSRLILDLPHFKSTKQFRYREIPSAFMQFYNSNSNTIITIPDREFKGSPYRAKGVTFDVLKSTSEDGYTFISIKGLKQYLRMMKTKDEKLANRGAMIKCPFAAERYLELLLKSDFLPALTNEQREENIDILYDLKPNPELVMQVLANQAQLN